MVKPPVGPYRDLEAIVSLVKLLLELFSAVDKQKERKKTRKRSKGKCVCVCRTTLKK